MKSLFNYPEYIEVNNKKYKIDTNFKTAIKCNDISMDQNISIDEKILAMIYLLFGKDELVDIKKDNSLIEPFGEKILYYLQCGNTAKNNKDNKKEKEPDMDFIQDMPFIEASFMSDYGISLEESNMHWWKFYHLIGGLSNSEMGNCCILNRIRNLRNTDLSEIKDPKERKKIKEAKEYFALKKEKKIKTFTEEELKNMEEYHKLIDNRKEQ